MFDRKLLTLPGMKRAFCACVLFSFIAALLIMAQASFLSFAIVVAWTGGLVAEAVYPFFAFALCYCLRYAVSCAESSFLEGFSHRIALKLRGELVGTLYENGTSLASAFGSAAIARELIDGFRDIEDYLAIVVPKMVSMAVIPIALIACIFIQDIVSGIIVLVCYPLIIIYMRLIGHSASDESAKRHDGFLRMSSHFLDALRGMSTLKSFGISRQYSKSVYKVSENYRKSVMRTLRIATLSSAILDLFSTGGLAAVAIMLGFRLVDGGIDFLPALTVLLLVPEFFAPIKAYAADYHASLNGKQALSKVMDMISTPKRKVDVRAFGAEADGLRHLMEQVQGVSDGNADKMHIAIMGPSGVGKTTLLNALAGVIDVGFPQANACCGEAVRGEDGDGRFDGKRDGEGLPSLDQRRIAYIPQSPYIFAGTIRDNIALYRPDIDDEALMEAARLAGLEGFVASAPHGLDEAIGTGGRGISGGEAQRIAIARALADPDRDIWLLDEPLSSLDAETEGQLHAELLGHMQGRMAIIATHKKAWAKDVDRVIELGLGLGMRS